MYFHLLTEPSKVQYIYMKVGFIAVFKKLLFLSIDCNYFFSSIVQPYLSASVQRQSRKKQQADPLFTIGFVAMETAKFLKNTTSCHVESPPT